MAEAINPNVYYSGLDGFLRFVPGTVSHPIEFTKNAVLTNGYLNLIPFRLPSFLREITKPKPEDNETEYDLRFPAQLVGASIGLAGLVYTLPLEFKLVSWIYEQAKEDPEFGIVALAAPVLTNLISAGYEFLRFRKLEQARYEEQRRIELEEARKREEEGVRQGREKILRDRGHRFRRNGKPKGKKEEPTHKQSGQSGLTKVIVGDKEVIMKDGIPIEEIQVEEEYKPGESYKGKD